MQLFRSLRQFEEEPPCRDHFDGPAAGIDPLILDPLVVQKFPERKGKHLPSESRAAHLGRDLLRQHPGRRTGEIHLAFFRAQQTVHEGLPTGDGLNLVEKTVDRLCVFLLSANEELAEKAKKENGLESGTASASDAASERSEAKPVGWMRGLGGRFVLSCALTYTPIRPSSNQVILSNKIQARRSCLNPQTSLFQNRPKPEPPPTLSDDLR